MQVRYFVGLFLVLILFSIVLLCTVKHTIKKANDQQIVKTSIQKAVKQTVEPEHKQEICIEANNCWIKNLQYDDPRRMDQSADLSDIEVKSKNYDIECSKNISICRNYAGDARITFRLKGNPSNVGTFKVTNTIKQKKPNIYVGLHTKFGKDGFADIVILLSKSKITTIYSDIPKQITFYQSKESTKT